MWMVSSTRGNAARHRTHTSVMAMIADAIAEKKAGRTVTVELWEGDWYNVTQYLGHAL